jgi:hypothetical protein
MNICQLFSIETLGLRVFLFGFFCFFRFSVLVFIKISEFAETGHANFFMEKVFCVSLCFFAFFYPTRG